MAWTNLIDLVRQVRGLLPIGNGGVPAGGTTGQALVKSSNTDNDVAWATASGSVTHTGGALTAHRVVVGNGSDDLEVIASAGSSGQFLKSAGSSADPAFANIAESDVTSLVSDLALKAPLASPALTGSPTAPTQSAGDNSTNVATTAYVDATKIYDLALYLPTLTASVTLAQLAIARAITLPASLTGSLGGIANSGINPSATITFSLRKNNVEFGTLAIDNAGAPTFAAAGSTSFNGTSDYFNVVAPSDVKGAAGLYFTLKGTR